MGEPIVIGNLFARRVPLHDHVMFVEQHPVERADISLIILFALGGNHPVEQFVDHRIFDADQVEAAADPGAGAAPELFLFVARQPADGEGDDGDVEVKIVKPVFENVDFQVAKSGFDMPGLTERSAAFCVRSVLRR